MKKHFVILLLIVPLFSKAQTAFTSQGFLHLSKIDPSMSGMGLNNKVDFYDRTQFLGFGEPFMNFGLGWNYGFKKAEPGKLNTIGIAAYIESENMMQGALQKNNISINIANRVFLDPSEDNFISVGLGTSFSNRYVDITKLNFGDQYNSGRLFLGSSLESFQKYPNFITSNLGVSFVHNNERQFFQMGYSLYYINRLATEALHSTDQMNAYLFNAMLNYEYESTSMTSFLLHAGYEKRMEKNYLDASIAIGLPLVNNYTKAQNKLYIGLDYRLKDATVPFVQLLYNQYKVGLSYDFYQNDLTEANINSKTFEITLTKSLRNKGGHKFQGLMNY